MRALEFAAIPSLVLGCVYAVISIGFVLQFKALKILSFAQASFLLFGALIFYTFTTIGIETYLALALSLLSTGALGGVSYWLAYSRKTGADAFLISFSTIGLGTLLSAIFQMIWGAGDLSIPLVFGEKSFVLTNTIRIDSVQIFTIIISVAVILAVSLWLRLTPAGLKMRATADRQVLATYYGVSVIWVGTFAWVIAAMCAAAGGIAYSAASAIDPGALSDLGFAVFAALIIGGTDSIAGAVTGGILIAVLGTVIGVEFGAALEQVVPYLALVAMLFVRPRGLFGSAEATRV
jgi:branched-chain amino acid transport system permease protein